MLDITRNDQIIVSRGDTFSLVLYINQGTEFEPSRFELNESDKVYFALLEPNQLFEDAIWIKEFSTLDLNENGDIVINIDPQDTINLRPGNYYYQIKLVIRKSLRNSQLSDEIHTIVDRTRLVIL